jgi:hypothetical protein
VSTLIFKNRPRKYNIILQKKPDWALGEKEGKSKSTSEAPPEANEVCCCHFSACQKTFFLLFAGLLNLCVFKKISNIFNY